MTPKTTAIVMTTLALTACEAQIVSPITKVAATASSSAGSAGPGGAPSGSSGPGGATTGLSGSGSCPDPTTLVYTADSTDGQSYALHTFDPATLAFTQVGTIVCPPPSAGQLAPVPQSMAIDAHGTAWILATVGYLYKLDIATGSCVSTPWIGDVIGPAGLTWIKDPAGSGTQLLYAAGGRVLTDVNTQYGNPTTIGDGFGSWSWDGTEDANPSLASTPDGLLFGVWRNAATVRQLNPSTSDVISTASLPAIDQGYSAVYWNGALLLAGQDAGATGSKIQSYDLATQVTTTLVPNAGFTIAAASVGSCAH